MTLLTKLYTPPEANTYPYVGTLAIAIGDLCYRASTGYAYPASSQADSGTLAVNQRTFARGFAGVSKGAHLASDAAAGALGTNGGIDIVPDWIGLADCAAATLLAGDLVTIAAGTGTTLNNQKVVKTTDPDLAIGEVVMSTAASATQVMVRLKARVNGYGSGSRGISIIQQDVAVADFTDGGSTSGYVDLTNLLPVGALVLGWSAVVTGAFAGDTTAIMKLGTSGSTGLYSTVTTGSCFAAGTIGSASTNAAGTLNLTAVAVRVTVTGGADFTSIVSNGLGAASIKLFYVPTI